MIDDTLREALAHHQAGRLQQAQALYQEVLQASPGHADANHNLGVVELQLNQAAMALAHLKAALDANPAQGQYWLSYIAALIQAGQPEAARQVLGQGRSRGLSGPQVDELAKRLGAAPGSTEVPVAGVSAGPTRAEMEQVVGLFGQGRYGEAEHLARGLTERYARHGFGWKVLGAVLKQLGRDEESLGPMRRAAELLPRDFEAHHNLGLALADTGRLAEAEASHRRALELKPDFVEAHFDLGNALKAQGRLSEAQASFRQAVRIRSGFAMAHYNLGNTLAEQGRPEQAEASLRRALELDPGLVEAHANLGSVLHTLGRLPEAQASYLRAVELKPDFADAHCNLGAILHELGRLPEAEHHCRRALTLDANSATAHCNLGNVLVKQGLLDQAEESYRRAIQIRPDFAEAHCNLGNTLVALDRPEEAGRHLRRAIELKPDYYEPCYSLGNLLSEQWRLSAAEACYERVLEIVPEFVDAHINLGNTLMFLGRLPDAEASYRRGLELNPNSPEAHNNLGLTLSAQGRYAEAESSHRRALELNPEYAEAWDNMLLFLNYDADRSAEEIFKAHREYGERFELPLRGSWPVHGNSPEAGRRLKVGYVSPDFRRHAVSAFLEPLLANHDKAAVEVVAYAEVSREDEVSARLKGYADHWVRTVGVSDEALAQRIGADGIDILVDLAGHTAGNRLGVFARKPAPVQVTWLGYPGSSGLMAMDYRMTDACADPQGSEAYYTERLLRLPDCLCCYRPGEDMPQVTGLPARENGYVTFGSFNNFNKINRQCIKLWARLLQGVPDSRLLMVTVPEGEPRQRLAEQFAALGIPAQRLELHGRYSGGEFCRMIQRADIALDPFPVTGGTTTCETLWMGVPVVVLVGKRYISRVGYSFLSAAGYPEFAAGTPEQYLEIASGLAGDLGRLGEIRAGMRAQVAASPLVDQVRFARNVERIYRQVWTEWCNAIT